MIVLLEMVIRLIENNQFGEARIIIMALLSEEPNNPEINYYCAVIHDLLGFDKKAINYYEQSISNNVQGELLEKTLIQLGICYRRNGKNNMAIKIFEKAIKHFPNNLAIQSLLAISNLYSQKVDPKVVSMLLNVITTSSSDPWIKEYSRFIKYRIES